MKPLVIQTEELDPACRDWLGERCELVACPSEEPRFAGLLARAEGLVIRTYTKVDAALLSRAPRLRVVGRAGVGLDSVDVAACRSRRVEVVFTPDANTRAVVELVTAFMLDTLRPRRYLEQAVPPAEWKQVRGGLIAPRQLCELTLGILGLGRIGRGVARAGAALDMRVIYSDIAEIPPTARAGAAPVGVDELFTRADVLSVHVDTRPSNARFVNADRLRRLPRAALVINTSRGFVVDAPALAAWLASDAGARAVLDVHEPEPFGDDYPLLGLPGARLTPHIGAATAPAHRNMSWVVRDVWRVLSGERPEFPAPE